MTQKAAICALLLLAGCCQLPNDTAPALPLLRLRPRILSTEVERMLSPDESETYGYRYDRTEDPSPPSGAESADPTTIALGWLRETFGSFGQDTDIVATDLGQGEVGVGLLYRGIPTDREMLVTVRNGAVVHAWVFGGILEAIPGSERDPTVTAEEAVALWTRHLLSINKVWARDRLDLIRESSSKPELRYVWSARSLDEDVEILAPTWVVYDPMMVDAHEGYFIYND